MRPQHLSLSPVLSLSLSVSPHYSPLPLFSFSLSPSLPIRLLSYFLICHLFLSFLQVIWSLFLSNFPHLIHYNIFFHLPPIRFIPSPLLSPYTYLCLPTLSQFSLPQFTLPRCHRWGKEFFCILCCQLSQFLESSTRNEGLKK